MIAPASLADLVATSPIAPLKMAILARLKTLLPGVAVIDHPGKVDISEIVGRTVVAAPGIALGWTRVRPVRIPDAGWHAAVDFIAYVVVEAKAIDQRRVEREQIGYAIGTRMLRILADPDEGLWGRGDVTPPEALDFKPFFTVRDLADGVAYYAVTWTQTIADIGDGLWSPVAAPAMAEDGAGLDFPDADTMDQALAALGWTLPDAEDDP